MQAEGMGPIYLVVGALVLQLTAGYDIRVTLGGDINFRLPSHTDCGQYYMLDAHLKPVVIIEGRQIPNLLGEYADRSTIETTDQGYNLTISNATLRDTGTFKLTSADGQTARCTDSNFRVVVHNTTNPDGVYFGAWSPWSTCERPCDPVLLQSRTRTCSIGGECDGLGDMVQNRTCDLSDSCPRWSEWGGWSNCSAMCGKGFKIRKRICVNGESALLKSTDCVGQSTQSHLCMTVCEVVGFWEMWSEWGDCNSDCGGGTRNRTRVCVRDSRVKKTSCDGDSLQVDNCNETPCTSTEDTSSTNPNIPREEKEKPLNIAVIVIVLCIAAIIVVLIPVLLLRKHRANNKAVDAIAVDRRTGGGRRKHKTSSTASEGDPQNCQTGINVYSELNSSFVYSSSEFDSVFLDDNGTTSVHVPTLENIAEEGEEHEHGHGDHTTQPADENDDNELNEQTKDYTTQESVYFEPPDETQAQISNVENKINEMINIKVDLSNDNESVYYEPPENSGINSRKISMMSIQHPNTSDFCDKERKESVYENISNVNRSVDNTEDHLSESYNTYSNKLTDFPETFSSSAYQSEAAREKEREAYNDDHIYVNATDTPIIEFSGSIDNDSEDHIYDTPKCKDN